MSDWRQVALTELVAQRRDSVKIESGVEYRLLGVRWYGGGAFHRETVTRETSKATTVYRVTPGQFIYNRLFAGKGSFGLVPPEFAGAFVSNEFPLFDTDTERLSAEYLNLYFQQRQVWDYVEGVSIGTTASRNRWKESQFLAHRIPLPPLPAQKRIVEVIGAVDGQIAALEAEASALACVMAAIRSQLLQPEGGWDEMAVGDLAETRTGRAFPDKYQGNANGEVPYFKVADMNAPANSRYLTTARNWLDGDGIAAVKPRICPPGTVVYPIIGAALATEKRRLLVQPSAFDQNLMGLVPNDRVLPEYLLTVMSSIRLSDLTQPGAVPSVNQRIVSAIRVPLAPRHLQEQIVETMDSLRGQVDATHAEAGRLRAVRAGLLSGLVGGTIEIESTELEV